MKDQAKDGVMTFTYSDVHPVKGETPAATFGALLQEHGADQNLMTTLGTIAQLMVEAYNDGVIAALRQGKNVKGLAFVDPKRKAH